MNPVVKNDIGEFLINNISNEMSILEEIVKYQW